MVEFLVANKAEVNALNRVSDAIVRLYYILVINVSIDID